jgi:hypothetical protein
MEDESDDFDEEPGYYKDVYFPDSAPDESPTEFLIRHHFALAGYEVRRIETAPTHPVIIIKTIRKAAPKITDQRQLVRHFQDLLKRAGFKLRRDELTVGRIGDRILAAFQWKDSPIDYAAGLRQADQDAMEFAEIPL